MTRRDPAQLGLFGTVPAASAPQSGRQCPPARASRRKDTGQGANPLVAKDVLAEIRDGRFALLDDTDRVLVFEDTDRVRTALDEDVVHHLISVGYVAPGGSRDTVSAMHGAIRRPVTPLKLTARGRTMLQRWSNLSGYPGGARP
ncbi:MULTISPECIES: hypothetical protein [unclassified Amycolatopsis]|uniref:hypothetical protein n=1 Tax=unclassified Amycolatopsis TaxID=2618356 RepID=UPI00106DE9FF|nr:MULTISPECIES: hypothetical protein [unclassified Amycolatopsis]